MEQFDAAIIGFGTAGLALGGALADDGQNIVVVEQSDTMYGGACVNNACIPTKALVESARLTAAVGGSIVEREERYTAAVDDMKELRSASRERNYRALADRENVDVIDGRASFANATHLTVATASGTLSAPVMMATASVMPIVVGVTTAARRPSRWTWIRSATSNTCGMLCEIRMIGTPRDFTSRISSSTRRDSLTPSAAVGSSRISTLAPK